MLRRKLASGERVDGALLIGADGLWSNVRQQVVGDGPPRVSGHTTYRSVIPTEQMPEDLRWNAATLWAGPKCHIVHYPLSGWKVFNLVVTYHNDAPEPVAGKPVSDDEVREGFAHVHERARKIISHGKDWRLWVLCDRDPVETLGRWPRRAARRCRPSDAAILGAGRLHGDGGRGVPVAHAGRLSRARPRRRFDAYQSQRCRAHRAGAAAVARHRRAHLSPRRRPRARAQRHHAREDVRRTGTTILAWLYGGTGLEADKTRMSGGSRTRR